MIGWLGMKSVKRLVSTTTQQELTVNLGPRYLKLIKAGMSHIRNESAEKIAYAQDMFETIFKDYKQEKDVHISGLLADLMNQTPVTAADFAALQ